jgi:predicted nucleic acid-binding protein
VKRGVVFDTGAVIALDRGDRAMVVLVAEARLSGQTITVPAGCVAQSWRAPARQARVAAFLRLPNVDVVALDDEDARRVGLLLARTKTTDIADGHVAVCAARLGQPVLTSDPEDLRALLPSLAVRRV